MQGERQRATQPIDGMVQAGGAGIAIHYRDWGGAAGPSRSCTASPHRRESGI